MSPLTTDDHPLTKIDNAAALSTNEATENSGTGPVSSRARPKDQSLRSLKFVTMCSRRVSQYLSVTRGPCLREQQNRCNYCTEFAVTARIRFAIVRFTSEGNHNRLDVGRKGVEVTNDEHNGASGLTTRRLRETLVFARAICRQRIHEDR